MRIIPVQNILVQAAAESRENQRLFPGHISRQISTPHEVPDVNRSMSQARTVCPASQVDRNTKKRKFEWLSNYASTLQLLHIVNGRTSYEELPPLL